MIYVIINNSTGAPASKIGEWEDLSTEIVAFKHSEDEVKEYARQKDLTRIHRYRKEEDGHGNVSYRYVNTIGV